MNLQFHFIAVPTVIKYLGEQAEGVRRGFDEFRAEFQLRQSIMIEAKRYRVHHELDRNDGRELFIYCRGKSTKISENKSFNLHHL